MALVLGKLTAWLALALIFVVGVRGRYAQCASAGRGRVRVCRLGFLSVLSPGYDWPVGYQPGARLSDVWKLKEHHLGEETFTHWPEGSVHKNRMQGNDYVQSAMYAIARTVGRVNRGRGEPCAATHPGS